MGGLIILALIIYAICAPSAKKKEKRRKAEAARIRAAVKWQKEQSQALLRKQREMEREQAKQRAEQERQRKEQERLAKEQERQAAQIAKHEGEIAKLKFRMEQAEANIEFYDERLRNLLAKRDNYMAQQTACTTMSKDWDKWQTKIITLDNQIHTAESKLNGAKFAKEQAQNKLSA